MEKEIIKIGYGYRQLEIGEIVIAGDEFLGAGKNNWRATSDLTLGFKVSRLWATHRRRVDVGTGYRLLSENEIIQEGDEFCDWTASNEWYEVCDSIGYLVGYRAPHLKANAFRRKEQSRVEAPTQYRGPAERFSVNAAKPPQSPAIEDEFVVFDASDGLISAYFNIESDAVEYARKRAKETNTARLVYRIIRRIEPVVKTELFETVYAN